MPTVRKVSAKPRAKRRGAGVLGRIGPISERNTSNIAINVYGRSGSGKTTFACTFPKPLLLIGTEDGTQSVHNVKGVEFVRLQESSEIREVIEAQQAERRWRTVVLDTASMLQDMVLKEILGIDELPAQKSFGMASRENWGQCALQTKEILRAVIGLRVKADCSVVVLAQEREFDTDSESDLIMPYVGSALSPSVTGWLNPACDYIVQTFIRRVMVEKTVKMGGKTVKKRQPGKGVEYCIRTGPDAVYTTKFRVPKGTPLPEDIVDPDYRKVLELIKGA